MGHFDQHARKMQRNAEKCRGIQINSEKCTEMQGDVASGACLYPHNTQYDTMSCNMFDINVFNPGCVTPTAAHHYVKSSW